MRVRMLQVFKVGFVPAILSLSCICSLSYTLDTLGTRMPLSKTKFRTMKLYIIVHVKASMVILFVVSDELSLVK